MARMRNNRDGGDLLAGVVGLAVVYGISQGVTGHSNVAELAQNILLSGLVWGGGAIAALLLVKLLWAKWKAHNAPGMGRLRSDWSAIGNNQEEMPRSLPAGPPSDSRPSNIGIPPTDTPTKWSLQLIRDLAWQRLEKLVAEVLGVKYLAVLTVAGADGGVDIHLYRKGAAPYVQHSPIALVQVKSRARQKVGVAVVRELKGVMSVEGVDKGVLVATAGYTDQAVAFAREAGITLINAPQLLHLINSMPEPQSKALLADIAQGDYARPECPTCAVPMVERVAGKGRDSGRVFWGCPGFPACRTTFKRYQGGVG